VERQVTHASLCLAKKRPMDTRSVCQCLLAETSLLTVSVTPTVTSDPSERSPLKKKGG